MMTNWNYLTVDELMDRWRCSRPTVLRYLQKYDVSVTRLGRRALVPEGEVARIEELRTSVQRI